MVVRARAFFDGSDFGITFTLFHDQAILPHLHALVLAGLLGVVSAWDAWC